MKTKIIRKKLKSGLKVLLLKNKSNKILIMLSVHVGSSNENKKNTGISHFVEHILWEGSTTRSAQKIRKEIDEINGSFNAYTGTRTTEFFIEVPKRHFQRGLEILADVIQKPVFDEQEIEKEKKIILNEMNQDKDDVRSELMRTIDETLYGNHPNSLEIIGTKESITSINKQKLEEHWKRYFVSNNSILALNGNLKNPLPLVKKHFVLQKGKVPKVTPFNPNTFKGPKIIKIEKPVQTSYVGINYMIPLKIGKSARALGIIENILDESPELSLMEEIRQKRGLTYSVQTNTGSTKSYSELAVHVSTDKKEIPLVTQIIYDQIRKMDNVNEKEVKKAKKKILKRANELKTNPMLRHPYTSSLISCEQQKAWKYFNDYKKNINKITAKDVQKTAKKYLKQNYALVTIEQKDPSDQDKLAEKH